MAGRKMSFETCLSKKSALKLEVSSVSGKKILRNSLWIIVCVGIIGLFYVKRATKFYLSTLPEPRNCSTYPDTGIFPVRGLHITSWVAASPALLKPLIELVKNTELNALVIDLKETDGRVRYDSRLKIVENLGTKDAGIANLDSLLATLKENNIFPIARICVFKDPLLAQKRPHLAVRDKNGSIWRDWKGLSWVDPYCKQVWEYNTAIAEEAAQRGFKEIQFDYIRFPSDGLIRNCVYTYRGTRADTPAIVIKNFLKYARERLRPYGVVISVDVFGLTCSAEDDLNIGQKIEEIAPEVDYICPMVYPSHYYQGMYNLKDPEAVPYQTVSISLRDAQRRVGGICRIRPWLQDFSLRIKYSAAEVLQQIKATYDSGIQEWCLWNPACRYTASILGPEDRRNIEIARLSEMLQQQIGKKVSRESEVILPEIKVPAETTPPINSKDNSAREKF